MYLNQICSRMLVGHWTRAAEEAALGKALLTPDTNRPAGSADALDTQEITPWCDIPGPFHVGQRLTQPKG